MKTTIDTRALMKNLKAVEPKLRKRILTGATKASAKVIQEKAITNAPEDSGDLKASIKIKKKRNSSKAINYSVGIDKSNPAISYAHMIEFGKKDSSPDFFMTNALNSTENEALQANKEYIKRRLDKLRKK